MMRFRMNHRLFAAIALALFLVPSVPTAYAQTTPANETVLILRPHCQSADADTPTTLSEFLKKNTGVCPNYAIRDPKSLETPTFTSDQTIDMDLILYNPTKKAIKKVRAWLPYDSQVLQGVSVEASTVFPVVNPSESDFSVAEGYLKFSAESAAGTEPSGIVIPVARIQMKVLRVPPGQKTPIGFYDVQPGVMGHTFAIETAADKKNLLATELPSLVVLLDRPASSSSTASTSSVSSGSFSSTAQTSSASMTASSESSSDFSEPSNMIPPERSTFVLLQPQNMRIGTEGSAMYLSWDVLPSSELIGYNVYYGTQKGRYIQRRSIAAQETNVTIRGLVTGTTYYAAVRGVNANGEETSFSQEAAVTIGDPRTSTAPLSVGTVIKGPNGTNPLTGNVTGVPGESGTSSMTLLIVCVSAVIGMAFAFRRQLGARSPSSF